MCAIWRNFLRSKNAGAFLGSQKIRHLRAALSDYKSIENNMKKIFLVLVFLSANALAQEKEFLIQIKDHEFKPTIITVPANQKFKLIVENLDKTLEEFESVELRKEKLVGAGKKIIIPIEALKPGEYRFFGDFHQKTAQGKIIAK